MLQKTNARQKDIFQAGSVLTRRICKKPLAMSTSWRSVTPKGFALHLFLCFGNWPDQLCLPKTCAVCPSIMTVKEGHFCFERIQRGKKQYNALFHNKSNTKEVKPSLLMYVIFSLLHFILKLYSHDKQIINYKFIL